MRRDLEPAARVLDRRPTVLHLPESTRSDYVRAEMRFRRRLLIGQAIGGILFVLALLALAVRL